MAGKFVCGRGRKDNEIPLAEPEATGTLAWVPLSSILTGLLPLFLLIISKEFSE